jgi:hypothetical protein
MATSTLMAIRINDSLALWRKLTRVMFCSVVAGKKHFMFFSRQKSPRCSLGGGAGPKPLHAMVAAKNKNTYLQKEFVGLV